MDYMYGTLVWICWLGNPPNSFSLPMYGFEEPYFCIHVYFGWFKLNLWLIWSWFSFGWKISSENGQNWPFLQKSQVRTGTES